MTAPMQGHDQGQPEQQVDQACAGRRPRGRGSRPGRSRMLSPGRDGGQRDERDERDEADPDADRRPELDEPAVVLVAGRLGVMVVVEVRPRVGRDAGLDVGPASGQGPDLVPELGLPGAQPGELRLALDELGFPGAVGLLERAVVAPARSTSCSRPVRPSAAVGDVRIELRRRRPRARRAARRSPRPPGAAGATLSSPRNPIGSFHDGRTEPVRVYFRPAGARSPANRSRVSRPHSPR